VAAVAETARGKICTKGGGWKTIDIKRQKKLLLACVKEKVAKQKLDGC
jgi:hypothetical protein